RPAAFSALFHRRHVLGAEMAAREMGGLSLADALSLCELLASVSLIPCFARRVDATHRLKRLVDLSPSTSSSCGCRANGVIAVGGVTPPPAAPQRFGLGTSPPEANDPNGTWDCAAARGTVDPAQGVDRLYP